MKNNPKFWNMLSKSYDEQVKRYDTAYAACIETTKHYSKQDDVVLDFACGTGIITTEIAPKVDKVLAIDISPKMLDAAQTKAESKSATNIDFMQTDISTLDAREHQFDMILAFNILHYMTDFDATLEHIFNLLKPGGYFISATDCIRDSKALESFFVMFFSRIGLFPKMIFFRITELEARIRDARFNILKSESVFTSPPNQLIVAQK